MLEQLLEPFSTWDAWTVGIWYVVCVVLALVLTKVHKKFGLIDDVNPLDDIPAGWLVIVAGFAIPVIEEVLFRGVPIYFNAPFPVIFTATVLWVIAHGRRALIIAPFGLLWMKLWMGGFGIEATAIHMLHNCLMVGIYLASEEVDLLSDRSPDELKSLVSNEPEVKTTIKINVSD